MRTVMANIMQHKKRYSKLPLFDYMRDESIPPWQRLAFYPCMAHFILSFGDLNKYVMRQEPAPDEYQELVNAHTYEDDHHWPWYLEDFGKLGLDGIRKNSDDLNFLWGEETSFNRVLMYRLSAMVLNATPKQRLAIIEAIEETGNVLFDLTAKLANQITAITGVEFRYLGDHHLGKETGHAMGSDHKILVNIVLDEKERQEMLALVEKVFSSFAEWTEELLRYAKAHPAPGPAQMPRVAPPEPIQYS